MAFQKEELFKIDEMVGLQKTSKASVGRSSVYDRKSEGYKRSTCLQSTVDNKCLLAKIQFDVVWCEIK